MPKTSLICFSRPIILILADWLAGFFAKYIDVYWVIVFLNTSMLDGKNVNSLGASQ